MLDLGLIVNVIVGIFLYKLTIALISISLEKILIRMIDKEKARKEKLEARLRHRERLRKILEDVEDMTNAR